MKEQKEKTQKLTILPPWRWNSNQRDYQTGVGTQKFCQRYHLCLSGSTNDSNRHRTARKVAGDWISLPIPEPRTREAEVSMWVKYTRTLPKDAQEQTLIMVKKTIASREAIYKQTNLTNAGL